MEVEFCDIRVSKGVKGCPRVSKGVQGGCPRVSKGIQGLIKMSFARSAGVSGQCRLVPLWLHYSLL